MRVQEVEIAVQYIELDACANLVDSRVLSYAREAHKLLCWVVLQESPLLQYARGHVLEGEEFLENGE